MDRCADQCQRCAWLCLHVFVTSGVLRHPRGVLIRTRALAAEMVDALGERPVVVLPALP
jgi:hypothetical protein